MLNIPVIHIVNSTFEDMEYPYRALIIIISKLIVAGISLYVFKVTYDLLLKIDKNNCEILSNNKFNNKCNKLSKKNKIVITTILLLILLVTFCIQYVMKIKGFNVMPFIDIYEFINIILYSVILMPIIEELVFRKYMISDLRRYGMFISIFISIIIFAVGHDNPANMII